MSRSQLYVAGIGMMTAVGADTAMCAAAVRAGFSGYRIADMLSPRTQHRIKMAEVPDEVFRVAHFGIDEGTHKERVIIMAIVALHEALRDRQAAKQMPLILTAPEPHEPWVPKELLLGHLLGGGELPLRADWVRWIDAGRAAGIQALRLAQQVLARPEVDYVVVGGSDSYGDMLRLQQFDACDRLLTVAATDGFVPGEGAGFLVLTSKPKLAQQHDGRRIRIAAAGIAAEPGHFFNDEPYRGEGLDLAFKQALEGFSGKIDAVYSSMNGENYWAKEYGVAYLRNRAAFIDDVRLEHPADCFGDLGAATGPVLLGLAAVDLWRQPAPAAHLVYASSDAGARAAARLETEEE
jgi:3-oxoacyl-[acyl-carrier-protein] synthase-1